jgi:hypothetical protein
MGKQPFISHVVNGYSRYDVPESKAFTCTPGILYPVRIDFINARDRVSIEQGIDVRSNPLAVPTFNPYTIRLHRFWVPLQLYHPELRTNSSKFDMNELSLNWIPGTINSGSIIGEAQTVPSNSLYAWLRLANKRVIGDSIMPSIPADAVALPSNAVSASWFNADTLLAYWDIVRNYYGYSQWGVFSYAWPGSSSFKYDTSISSYSSFLESPSASFSQCFGNLAFLDAYYESQFYPSSVTSSNNTFNRGNIFLQILNSDVRLNSNNLGAAGDGYPVASVTKLYSGKVPEAYITSSEPVSKVSNIPFSTLAVQYFPMAVVPSNPDRYSRALPIGADSAVSMSGIQTIPQLAIASRLQEYKDLLGAGGSRYSDWLETFFASKIEHIDRPKLLFSASQTVNVQIVMNQAGLNNFSGTQPLGQQGGAIAFNDKLGRRQSYYFREPGYMIDMLSIRPVYYWATITPDYLSYCGADYFNPIYNDIGYQDIPVSRIASRPPQVDNVAVQEPCFNEFRSSYDEVLGQLNAIFSSEVSRPLYSYWVQQRSESLLSLAPGNDRDYYTFLYVDISQVNSPFASNSEDNFFVNLSYAVQKKNLVNKTFATRLSNR